jgi:uncharacterized protein YcfJ
MAIRNTPLAAEGVGATSGSVSGAIIGGGIGGPAGAAVGAVIGAAAGAVVGYGLARALEPAEEDAYWLTAFRSRPYVKPGSTYDDYRDAYRYGWRSRLHESRSFEEAAEDLERGWEEAKADSMLEWCDAKYAVRDGWHRVEPLLIHNPPGRHRTKRHLTHSSEPF